MKTEQLTEEAIKSVMKLAPYDTANESNTHVEISYNSTVIFCAPKAVAVSVKNSLNGAFREGVLLGLNTTLNAVDNALEKK